MSARPLTQAEFNARMTPPPISLDRLEQVVTLREERARRARAKLTAARTENIAAMIDLCHAKAERTAFIAAQAGDEPVML